MAQVLDYLNSQGSSAGLLTVLRGLSASVGGSLVSVEAEVANIDVTGDTVPDVVLELNIPTEESPIGKASTLAVFVCQDGTYRLAFSHEGLTSNVTTIRDMNADGVPEIAFSEETDFGADVIPTYFYIVEWNSTEFEDLITTTAEYARSGLTNSAFVVNGEGTIQDIDVDGLYELVLHGGFTDFEGAPFGHGGPRRDWTEVWAWNGYAFILARSFFDTPLYRFQAVQDGDDATRRGEYDQALAFYQQAAFDEALLGWAEGQLWPDYFYEYAAQPTPAPDPEERARLSAYARFRILLLHVLRGDLDAAQIAYDTLQDQFPSGSPGYAYSELASRFWDQYTFTQDLAASCAEATDYALRHQQDILAPLGSAFYGETNRDYTPADVCPLG